MRLPMKWSLLLLAGWALACGEPVVNDVPVRGGEATGVVEQKLAPSTRTGMGATLYSGGVMFRVWAPYATNVWVTGQFNNWGKTELGKENNGSGNFSGDVAGAQAYQEYRFITRNQWGGEASHPDPRAARMTNSSGNSIVHNPNDYPWSRLDNYRTPSFNEMVIYEMHIGTFRDDPGFGPGNWNSAISMLDHVAGLGVNMIEVMPPYEFPGDFSWGYNPAFPFAPEQAYGTPYDMKRFIDEAHKRGMGVIFDVVHNHWGPNDLPMWCFSGDCLGNGGEYFYTDYRKDTPWGSTRPDYGRQEVRNYIRDSVMMLLHEYRADGLRWDATKYMRTTDGSNSAGLDGAWTVFRSINDEINNTQPWKISIAEDFGGGDVITQGTGSGGAGFDSQWAGEFVHPVRAAVITQYDSARDMNAVKNAIYQKFNGSNTTRIIYTESHDEVANGHARVPEEIWPGKADSWASKKRSTLAAGVMLTSPGIPLMFQGQEFLEDGYFAAEDPLDWGKSTRFGGIINLYRDLIKLRRNFNNNTRGLRSGNVNVHHVNNTNKVIAYHRWEVGGGGDDVVVVANFSGQYFEKYTVGFPRGGLWYARFNSDASVYSSDFGNTRTLDTNANGGGMDGMGQSGTFSLGPYSLVIFSQ